MNKLIIKNFNFETNLMGGQAFNWVKKSDGYVGFFSDKIIKIAYSDNLNELLWQTYPWNDDFEYVKKYFRLDMEYDLMIREISKDEHIKNAIKKYKGVRLLQQDFEQTVISYLFSARKNIKSIRNSILAMSQSLGEDVIVHGERHFLFPKTEVIAEAAEQKLKEFGLGFRAKYIKSAAQSLLKSNISQSIHTYSTQDARLELKKLNGVGDKIADCVLLYSLGHDQIMPLDVWGKRIITDLYHLDPKLKYDQMSEWFSNYYGKYSGWAGQILFEWIRDRNSDTKY